LSGSAAWAYYAVTQHILGVQPDYAGLRMDPCLPSGWREVKITRVFRGKNLRIIVTNPDGVQKGVKSVKLNGKLLDGNLIAAEELKPDNSVVVVMG